MLSCNYSMLVSRWRVQLTINTCLCSYGSFITIIITDGNPWSTPQTQTVDNTCVMTPVYAYIILLCVELSFQMIDRVGICMPQFFCLLVFGASGRTSFEWCVCECIWLFVLLHLAHMHRVCFALNSIFQYIPYNIVLYYIMYGPKAHINQHAVIHVVSICHRKSVLWLGPFRSIPIYTSFFVYICFLLCPCVAVALCFRCVCFFSVTLYSNGEHNAHTQYLFYHSRRAKCFGFRMERYIFFLPTNFGRTKKSMFCVLFFHTTCHSNLCVQLCVGLYAHKGILFRCCVALAGRL